jgi:hypothetical protein
MGVPELDEVQDVGVVDRVVGVDLRVGRKAVGSTRP